MVHLELLVEEESAKDALDLIVPTITGLTPLIRALQGKDNLLRQLPSRLRGYANMPAAYPFALMVLVDRDHDDCHDLKAQIEAVAHAAGLMTKTAGGAGRFQMVTRIVVEELEAWYLGDFEAIHAAYPKIAPSLATSAKYRDPDAVMGGAYEALHHLLTTHGYRVQGKRELARTIAPHMQPSRNRSHSFQVFVAGLRALLLKA